MTIILHLLGLINRLKNDLTLYANVELGQLSTATKSIALRIMPSTSENYYSDDRTKSISFQILTKSDNLSQTINMLEQITDKLIEYGCNVYTEIAYLQQDEQGYIYTASFSTDI